MSGIDRQNKYVFSLQQKSAREADDRMSVKLSQFKARWKDDVFGFQFYTLPNIFGKAVIVEMHCNCVKLVQQIVLSQI